MTLFGTHSCRYKIKFLFRPVVIVGSGGSLHSLTRLINPKYLFWQDITFFPGQVSHSTKREFNLMTIVSSEIAGREEWLQFFASFKTNI